jgi:hypothetical protein
MLNWMGDQVLGRCLVLFCVWRFYGNRLLVPIVLLASWQLFFLNLVSFRLHESFMATICLNLVPIYLISKNNDEKGDSSRKMGVNPNH